MKTIKLSREGALKLKRNGKALFIADCQQAGRSYLPGEWVQLSDDKSQITYLAMINLNVAENVPHIHILSTIDSLYHEDVEEQQIGEDYIQEALERSIEIRTRFKGYENGCRLVYGVADGLPGLIVECYQEIILIQINTAGLDRFRQQILEFFHHRYTKHKVVIFDNPQYRLAEELPIYQQEWPFQELRVEENGFSYCLRKNHLQKIGVYFDHRNNRERFSHLLQRYNYPYKKGVDLFCYAGSWGLHLLKAGVLEVTFVDQGDLKWEVDWALSQKGWSERGQFVRGQVYDFLDQSLKNKNFFDVICSDPPAFAKSAKQKTEAMHGYRRLHEKILQVINPGGVVAICSCTHYVSLEELDETIQDAAYKVGRKVFLLDTGLQGWDHPVSSMRDKGYYLKYLAYRVES